MTKLHELLAVESNLENQAAKTRTELVATFDKKGHLFEEKKLVFIPSEEGKSSTVEAQSDIHSTVRKELDRIGKHLQKALDASYQVAEANMQARADIVLENEAGTVLVKEVPATALLELEKRVAEIHNLLQAVPTLDPAKGFVLDPERGKDIYQAREVTKTRTKKDVKVIVKYEATREHPAQTEMVNVDVPIGTLQEQEWSGLITPAEKAELLDRAETLLRAVRRARSRANDTEVDLTKKIGGRLLRYVFNGQV